MSVWDEEEVVEVAGVLLPGAIGQRQAEAGKRLRGKNARCGTGIVQRGKGLVGNLDGAGMLDDWRAGTGIDGYGRKELRDERVKRYGMAALDAAVRDAAS